VDAGGSGEGVEAPEIDGPVGLEFVERFGHRGIEASGPILPLPAPDSGVSEGWISGELKDIILFFSGLGGF
jgi:hypothetical protein